MKELKRPETIYIGEYDINLRPYLTLQEQEAIVSLMLNSDNLVEREVKLITGVVEFCTDIPTDSDVDINDIIISGLWDEIQDKMGDYIWNVEHMVSKYDSMDFTFSKLVNLLAEKLDSLANALPNENQLVEIAKGLLEKDVDK